MAEELEGTRRVYLGKGDDEVLGVKQKKKRRLLPKVLNSKSGISFQSANTNIAHVPGPMLGTGVLGTKSLP